MTYSDLHSLAVTFVNEDEDTRDLLRPDALRFRMFLSKFLQRVKQAERTTGDLLQFEKKEVSECQNQKH